MKSQRDILMEASHSPPSSGSSHGNIVCIQWNVPLLPPMRQRSFRPLPLSLATFLFQFCIHLLSLTLYTFFHSSHPFSIPISSSPPVPVILPPLPHSLPIPHPCSFSCHFYSSADCPHPAPLPIPPIAASAPRRRTRGWGQLCVAAPTINRFATLAPRRWSTGGGSSKVWVGAADSPPPHQTVTTAVGSSRGGLPTTQKQSPTTPPPNAPLSST
jgi:hypothetical protein